MQMKKVEHEVEVAQPVEEVWRVWIKNFKTSMPLILPQHYSSVEYLDGPPLATGGVFLIKHNRDSFPHFDYIKARWEAVDHAKFYFKAAILEGGHLGEHSGVHNLYYSGQLVPGKKPNTCITKWTFEYDESVDHEFIDFVKEEMSILGTAIESYIGSNA